MTTASAALRGVGRVHPDTVARVEAVAKQIGYQANQAAAALRRGDGALVGLVLETEVLEDDESSPKLYWPRFLGGLTRELTANDIGLVLVAGGHSLPLSGLPVAALVVLGDRVPSEVAFGLPVISATAASPGTVASVGHSYPDAAALGVGHLVANGARSIGFLTPSVSLPYMADLTRSFAQAGTDAGTRFSLVDDLVELRAQLAAQQIDAIITPGRSTVEILTVCESVGAAVPDDVLLLSLTEGEIEAHLKPTVSSLTFEGAKSGRVLGQMLATGLAEHEWADISLPFTLIERESTSRGWAIPDE